jgi:hypothetical protein
MSYEVVRVERVGAESIKLVRKGTVYRVVSVVEPQAERPAFLPFTMRWTFKTGEVARLAFEFALAVSRFWHAYREGLTPRPDLGLRPRRRREDAQRRARRGGPRSAAGVPVVRAALAIPRSRQDVTADALRVVPELRADRLEREHVRSPGSKYPLKLRRTARGAAADPKLAQARGEERRHQAAHVDGVVVCHRVSAGRFSDALA